MAAQLLDLNYDTRFARFTIDLESDLNNLPKLDCSGTDSLKSVDGVSQGSMAYCVDGKDYILSGENEWSEYIQSDNSTSEHNKIIDSFVFEFYMTNIDIYEYEGMYFGTATFVGTPTYDYIYKLSLITYTNSFPIISSKRGCIFTVAFSVPIKSIISLMLFS